MNRTERAAAREIDELRRRLQALAEIAALGEQRLDDAVLSRIRATSTTAAERLGHGTSHTVVALAGATGSGKSSLFNALTGTEWATTGIRRPTTSSPMAAVYGDGAGQLLDWLQIPSRQRLDAGALDGLVLLDLPDHDSTVTAHRAEVDRLVTVVDVFCWVVDPQKYADAALHEGYLRRFAGHGAVSLVLLNQVDRLDAEARAGTVTHLQRLLADDGLHDVRVIPMSAITGEGVDALRRELAARVAERRAVVTRIDADLDWLATDLTATLAPVTDRAVSREARRQLVVAGVEAAGATQIENAVAGSYRHHGVLAVGWPPLRWFRNARPDPLTRLGLRARRPAAVSASAGREEQAPVVRRSSVTADPMAGARLDEALRAVARDAGEGLPDRARLRVEEVVAQSRPDLPDALDEAAGRADLHLDPPTWWRLAGIVQWLATAAMLVGLVWMLVLWGLVWLRFPEPPTPFWRDFPLPGLLLVGGAAVGLLLALAGRRLATVGARRRGRLARQSLADEVTAVMNREVVEPVNDELQHLAALRRAAASL